MNENECIIGIGSNINPENNIKTSLTMLAQKVEVMKTSSWTKIKPLGIIEQDDFMNGAVKIRTTMSMEELIHYLKGLEDGIGRDRTLPKYGPRMIDFDIIVWNDEIVDNDYYTRDFVRNAIDELK
ncbi:2-amino-4-hydroxy-6-hydroxymethyldihydropteridine diphosphokinase [Nitrosomonas supralitoralis]|uniref:2-amino-4-hydroxy-6-hydroxymethyldihydropteridine pyrophosphokinase n=1 Tax=Nitrosomonas supralitoralis TaxID=2116706 RepID=A0A2P7NU63_9PROT|nr:2-amino-4-hydroxy-6-hydroxymethyldihydropteridine diphosphokinase [Nitrosomonas supralitoralis]PSJ17011.1 2-amino-4-hydroxy-6-hydroxymethyldihydropteridine diphosphokinase [Nitrosomonas supralitoralis]